MTSVDNQRYLVGIHTTYIIDCFKWQLQMIVPLLDVNISQQ